MANKPDKGLRDFGLLCLVIALLGSMWLWGEAEETGATVDSFVKYLEARYVQKK